MEWIQKPEPQVDEILVPSKVKRKLISRFFGLRKGPKYIGPYHKTPTTIQFNNGILESENQLNLGEKFDKEINNIYYCGIMPISDVTDDMELKDYIHKGKYIYECNIDFFEILAEKQNAS